MQSAAFACGSMVLFFFCISFFRPAGRKNDRQKWRIFMTAEAQAARGLENVVVASTKLSAIDGTAGRLSYAGYDIHDLAERATYEEVLFLLWYGELPSAHELHDFNARLLAERSLSESELALVRGIPAGGHGM